MLAQKEDLYKIYSDWPYDRKVVPKFLQELKKRFLNEKGLDLPYARVQRWVYNNLRNSNEYLKVSSEEDHFIRWMQYLWPDMDFDPWRIDMIKGFIYCKRNRKKEYCLHGASNCRKTSTIAMILCALWWLNPKFTTIYITSPYKEASETGLFSAVVEVYQEAKERHPWLEGEYMPSKFSIRLDQSRYPRSFIRVATVDALGKMIGKKPKDPGKGMLIMACDEAPEFKPNTIKGFLKLLTNMKSLKNFMVIAAGNFAMVNDLLGILSEPALVHGYSSLIEEESSSWKTVRGGLVKRYNGEVSPNVILGYEKYEGINTEEYCREVESDGGGKRSPDYYRFVLSFPVLDLDEFTILTIAKIQKNGGYKDPEWSGDTIVNYAFCDPGWGGDPCAIQKIQVGKAWFVNEQTGERKLQHHIHIPEDKYEIKVKVPSATNDEQPIEDQIVQQVKTWAFLNDVPHKNIGFDGSLRSGIVHAFASEDPAFVPIDNLGTPTERNHGKFNPIWGKDKTSKDLYADYNTEQHFDVAGLVGSGQMTGFQNVPEAVHNLTTRKWSWSGKKKKIEDKAEYKKSNRNKSPTGSDTLVGAVQMALRDGFAIGTKRSGRSFKHSTVAELYRRLEKKRRLSNHSHYGKRRTHKLSVMSV